MIPKRDKGSKHTTMSPTAGRSNRSPQIVRTRLHVRQTSQSPPTSHEVQDNQAGPEQSPQQTSIRQYQYQIQPVHQQSQRQRETHVQRPRRRSESPEEQENGPSPSTANFYRPLGPTFIPSPTSQAASASSNNNKKTSLKLHNIPDRWSLLNLYKIFEKYGQIEYLEVYEDNSGNRNGHGKITFW